MHNLLTTGGGGPKNGGVKNITALESEVPTLNNDMMLKQNCQSASKILNVLNQSTRLRYSR